MERKSIGDFLLPQPKNPIAELWRQVRPAVAKEARWRKSIGGVKKYEQAAELGIQDQHFSNLINGQSNPSAELMVRMLSYYDLEVIAIEKRPHSSTG